MVPLLWWFFFVERRRFYHFDDFLLFTIFGINRQNFNYEPKGNFEIRGDKIRHLKHDWSIITKPIVKNYFFKIFYTMFLILNFTHWTPFEYSKMWKLRKRLRPPPLICWLQESCVVCTSCTHYVYADTFHLNQVKKKVLS